MSLDQAEGAVLDEHLDSPQPSPSIPPQSRGPLGMFFSGSPSPSAPTADPDSDPLTGPSPFESDAGSASAGGWSSDPDESSEETGPPASSADGGPLKPLGKAALKATSRKGVLVATSALHRIAARHELEQAAGLYIADEQDQELIGDPIANLLHRRGGIVGGKMSEDANDALSAAMGLANYIGKQMALTMELGRLKAAGFQVPQPPQADGQVA